MPVIIHAADLHIGAKFDFLPAKNSSDAVSMQFNALENLVRRASFSHTNAVLIAGDLFDSPDVPPQVASAVFAFLGKCPCPVLIAPGNHDYYHSGSVYATVPRPENIHVFTDRVLTPVPLSDEKTVIWGAAFQDKTSYIPLEAELDPTKINICLMHGELGGDAGYNPISERAALKSGFDYIALGHNHKFSGVFRIGSTALSCPGCFCATRRDETGIKGYLAGTVDKKTVSLSVIPSGALAFCNLEQSMNGIANDEVLAESLLPMMPEEPSRTCCTVHLTGTRVYEPDLDSLRCSLNHTFFYAAISDESAELRDLFRYAKDDGLRGTVTRDFSDRLKQCEDDEQQTAKLTLALEYALAALEGRELE